MTSVADNEAWLSQLTGIPLDHAPPEAAADAASSAPPESAFSSPGGHAIVRLRGIFSSLEEEVITEVVVSNRGALYPSILQLIEIADDDETAGYIDELEKALQDAAISDGAPGLPDVAGLGRDMDEQIAIAAQSDMDEQIALALQQKLAADASAAAAAAAAAAGARRASTPPTLSSWRGNVAKLAAMLSPSELRKVLERVKKSGRYRGRAGTARLIDPSEEAGVTTADNNESSDNNEPDEREYEPPVPVPPAPKPSPAALYESRVARARSARLASRSSARPNEGGFVDLGLVPEAA